MLALLGFLMVATFVTLIMAWRLPAVVALIAVPVAFGLALAEPAMLPGMMLDGLRQVAPTGVMLMFAILYFGLMIDAGLFDPAVRALLRAVRGDPLRVAVGTVLLAAFVSLDGDGSTTYMITVAALLPLYRRLGMSPLIMTTLIMLASGVMNLTPWGGPTARVASALGIEPAAAFVPMIAPMCAALAVLVGIAVAYGRAERARAAGSPPDCALPSLTITVATDLSAHRPGRLPLNACLTAGLIALLIADAMPLPVLFMAAFAAAAMINYPRLEDLKPRIAAHAPNVLAVVSLIFAAGAFTGILSGTGMVEAMSRSLLAAIPEAMGPYLAPITAVVSLPMTYFLSNDAFYFGVVPVLAEVAAHYGVSAQAIASAALVGQPVHLLSPLVPSTYLLVGLAGVEFGEHHRFALRWAIVICTALLGGALLFGAFPIATV